MKALKVLLPFVMFSLAGGVFAQNADSPNGRVAPGVVIVSWRHFSSAPATDLRPSGADTRILTAGPESDPPDPPLVSDFNSSNPDSAPVAFSSGPASSESARASDSTQVRITEQDIRHKATPPQPVQIPLADQDVTPLQSEPTSTSPAAQQAETPQSEVALLTTGYEQREAQRDAQCQQIEAEAAQDPTLQALAQVKETQLLLEGEQDRMESAQEVSKAFADLAEKLRQRAKQVQSLAEARTQAASGARSQIAQLDSKTPRLDLALHNIAMLPQDAQNDDAIRSLDSQLTEATSTRKHDEEVFAQASQEARALNQDVAELNRAATEARKKSAEFIQAAQNAKMNEGRLTDRLQFAVARQRAGALLTSSSKVLQSSVALTGNVAVEADVLGSTKPATNPVANQLDQRPVASSALTSQGVPDAQAASEVDRLRDCIRKTGNVNACRTKGGQ